MSYSNVTYIGDGAATDYTVPFPYLDQAHVSVTVDGAAATFSWIGSATVRVSPAPANGLEVRISRDSNRVARLADYQDAQVLTEADMDADALQIFYVAQEAFDAVADAPTGGDMRRSMNLSDVYDLDAARQNIGAVNVEGDTMTGPLVLSAAPSAPNHAVTKAYVDGVLNVNDGDVSSFNTRTGDVTLQDADVVAALGYTPVDKAGDSMLGPLSLAADPSSPLHAATKQYVDANGGGADTGEYAFPDASPTTAAMLVNKTVTANTSDRAGSANLILSRNAGAVPMVAFQHTYTIRTGNTLPDGDVGMRSNIIGVSGPIVGLWGTAVGPRTNPGATWRVSGGAMSVSERVADQGFKRDRLSSHTASLLVSPSAPINVGDGPAIGYNTTYGIAFTAATPASSTQRMWTPLFFEMDCTVPLGIQAEHRGGSTPALAPLCAIEIRDNFKSGIDMRSATFDPAGDNTAIWLAQEQAIHLSPTSRIYTAADGNMTFFDSIAGSKTLNTLGGGVGTNILPLANTWTNSNKFLGTTAESVVSGDPSGYSVKVSRTAPASGSVEVKSGLLVCTTTQAASPTFEWNALFHLDNYATGGENVGVYSQVFKRSTGPTWAGVFEARDYSGSGNALYGLEIDLCADGLDASLNHLGIGLYYGANTNTFGGGSTTKQAHGILIAPFVVGRNTLGNGIKIEGYADYNFNTSAGGLSAFAATGAYSSAVIDISSVTSSPLAIAFAPGSRMHFASGTGNGSNQTYFGGGFTPNYVGAIEVVIDGGVKRYIPLALNHP